MINPYVLLGIAVLWLATIAGTGWKAFELGKAEDSITWQKKWEGQLAKEQAAVDVADGDRKVLQNLANQLGQELAEARQKRDQYFNKLASKTHEDAKKELPVDDHVCDLPASLLDDWNSASADPRPAERGRAAGGVNGQVPAAPASSGLKP